MSRKVHVRFWSRVGRGDLPCLDNYHVKLHCYCVVELKATEFKPEYTGKLNFYLSAVDDLLRGPEDNPTIGMLLCQSKDSMKVKYALQGMQQPVAQFVEE